MDGWLLASTRLGVLWFPFWVKWAIGLGLKLPFRLGTKGFKLGFGLRTRGFKSGPIITIITIQIKYNTMKNNNN